MIIHLGIGMNQVRTEKFQELIFSGIEQERLEWSAELIVRVCIVGIFIG